MCRMGVSVVSLSTVVVTLPSCIHFPSLDGGSVLDYTMFVNVITAVALEVEHYQDPGNPPPQA